MKRLPVAVLLPILAVTSLPFAAAADDSSQLKITAKRVDDRAVVHVENGKAIAAIHSPLGISSATFERVGDEWPKVLAVRLHLNGLERFAVTNEKVTLEGSVAHGAKPKVRQWQNGKEESPIGADSPFWTEVRLLDRSGKVTEKVDGEGGCFELMLPKVLFERNPKTVTVRWIDFYRD